MINIDILNESLSSLAINEEKKRIITIQKWYRGCINRLKRLPLIMYQIQKYLKTTDFEFSFQNEDGRINSCIDEGGIILLLVNKFGAKIKKPCIRMWYDILVFDSMYGWLPVNIKTTTISTCDNTGNLAMCVYAYTDDTNIDIHREKTYKNGIMSELLIEKFKKKEYNKNNKKDYYFIVLNKTVKNDIIVNSVKGLTLITPNNNNLPFQVNWNKNRDFQYENVSKKIKLFVKCLQKSKPSWNEIFMENIRTLEI